MEVKKIFCLCTYSGKSSLRDISNVKCAVFKQMMLDEDDELSSDTPDTVDFPSMQDLYDVPQTLPNHRNRS